MGINQETHALTLAKPFLWKRFNWNGERHILFNEEKLAVVQRKATKLRHQNISEKDITYMDQKRFVNNLGGGFGFFFLRNKM